MIKTFGTALILATTLAFGITDAQAHSAPKAYVALVGIKRDCKVRHGNAGRCHVTKQAGVKHAVRHHSPRATIDAVLPERRDATGATWAASSHRW
jgi:hypothetical protein